MRPIDLLFLDFDGVLHPAGGGRLFAQTPFLVRVLEAHPALRLVISSDWRLGGTLTRPWIGRHIPQLAGRIIGCTPEIMDYRRRHFPGDLPMPWRTREREIFWFLHFAKSLVWRFRQGRIRHWLAVDDDPELFSPEFAAARVYITPRHTGLVESDGTVLAERLEATRPFCHTRTRCLECA